MALHDNCFPLRHGLSEAGLHPSDLILEIREATLASGTVEVSTIFKDGNIVALFAQRSNNATPGAGAEGFSSDLVVTSGAVTVVSSNATSTAQVRVIIIGRLEF
jgi:hypothetical protein